MIAIFVLFGICAAATLLGPPFAVDTHPRFDFAIAGKRCSVDNARPKLGYRCARTAIAIVEWFAQFRFESTK